MAVVEVRAGWFYKCGCGWMSHWWNGNTTSRELDEDSEMERHKKRCPSPGGFGALTSVLLRPPVGFPDPRAEGPEIHMVQTWR